MTDKVEDSRVSATNPNAFLPPSKNLEQNTLQEKQLESQPLQEENLTESPQHKQYTLFEPDSAFSLPSIATNAANSEVHSSNFGSPPSLTEAETKGAQQQSTVGVSDVDAHIYTAFSMQANVLAYE